MRLNQLCSITISPKIGLEAVNLPLAKLSMESERSPEPLANQAWSDEMLKSSISVGKAAILHETGHPLIIESDIQIPPLQPEQVLVKVEFSGVPSCFS